jgi:hypothetical protein
MAAADQVQSERLNERRFARAGCAADADADRGYRVGQQSLQYCLSAYLIVAACRLDQRDRLCKRTPLAAADPCDERLVGGR